MAENSGYSIKIRRRRRKNTAKKKENKKLNKGLLFLFAIVASAGIISKYAVDNSEAVYHIISAKPVTHKTEPLTYLHGVTIDGIDIGGLTYEQAENLLSLSLDTKTEGNAVTIKSTDGSKQYTYSYDDFGISYNVERALKNAMEVCTVEEEYLSDLRALENGGIDFSVYSYSIPKITSFVRAIANDNTASPKNATCTGTVGNFDIQPEQIGYSVDFDKLLKQTLSTIDSRTFNSVINFDITTIQPTVTTADFAYVENRLSSFASPYTGGDENRIQNLRNGCAKINGTIVYPDEVFSTNDAFNPCTEANGWANAPTIVGGKLEDSIGGGMCQVSSALYDAVLYAELEVVERYNHSLKVGYSPYAFDATLAGDYLDLKFRNNTGYPIYLESYLTDSNVVVNIYGYNRFPSTRTIKFENKFIEDIPHGDYEIVYDPELPEGTEEIKVSQLLGKKYELYKYVYENGVLTETIKVNTSTYKPRDGEKHIGTGTAQTAGEPNTEENYDEDDD